MKTFISLCFIALLLFSCKSKSDEGEKVDLTPVIITMDINGMTCNGCVETVRASVAQLGKGINSVEVNLEKATAVIEFEPAEIDSVKIRKAIEINGYKVLAVKEAE
jgi:copper chaperone CopZ